jgi:general secretion pathway protein J
MINYGYINNPGKLKTQDGFTLFEILIAMFIFAVVLSTIYGSYTGTFRIIGQAESQSEIYHMARVALERIIEDLESVYISENKSSNKEKEDSYNYLLFIGEDKEIEGRPADNLSFISMANIDLGGQGQSPGVKKINYYVEKNSEGDDLVLYRREAPIFEKELDFAGEKEGLILCEKLVSVNFSYHETNEETSEEWDSFLDAFKGKIPGRVSIFLEFVNAANPEEPIKFFTSVFLPLGQG